MAKTVRAHVFVNGRVQGVGFRAFTCRQAECHGLTGWVRNTADGRVEMEAQGNQDAVDGFLVDLERGPALSSVGEIEVAWIDLQSQESVFEVKY